LEFGADPVADSYRPFDGKPMWMEPMCGVDAITVLINHGFDLKRRNPTTGEALLLYVMGRTSFYTEEGSLAIIKQLADRGADLLARNASGFTPLLRAADDQHNDGCLSLSILDFLLERNEYGQIEKIEAMELAGATILSKAQYNPHFPKAFDYWHRSLHLRHQLETTEDSTSSKNISGRKIGSHLEWTTFAELDRLMLHPEEYRFQALLVKLRILSGSGGHRHRFLFTQYVKYISDSTTLKDDEKFSEILDMKLRMFALVIRRPNPLPTHSGAFWIGLAKDVDELVSTLLTIQVNHPTLLSFEKLKTALDLVLLAKSPIINDGELEANNSPIGLIIRYCVSRYFSSLFHVLEIIFHRPEIPNVLETTSLIQSLRLLRPCRLGNLLVDCGAKLHQLNNAGKTALDIWIESNETAVTWNEAAGGWSARPQWCLPVQSLLRLAARVIRVNKIPYKDGKTPTVLHPLIELR